ncbi:hypothetical protein C426_1960 [Lactococcus garvieae DCC43]|uniref:Uncharacterized protein n=2 Tax=Lactococcus garvieae TaxID=1363 RepID=K2PGZ3_9LACT|nr:hypothetical protein C426_1960 [Lactococcus garvieae DCC43]
MFQKLKKRFPSWRELSKLEDFSNVPESEKPIARQIVRNNAQSVQNIEQSVVCYLAQELSQSEITARWHTTWKNLPEWSK